MYVDFEIIYPSDEQVNDEASRQNVFGGKETISKYNWTGQVTSSEKEISNLAVGLYYIVTGCQWLLSQQLNRSYRRWKRMFFRYRSHYTEWRWQMIAYLLPVPQPQSTNFLCSTI